MKNASQAVLQSSIENAIELAVSLKTQGFIQDENVVNFQLEKLILNLADANWALASIKNHERKSVSSTQTTSAAEAESWSIY